MISDVMIVGNLHGLEDHLQSFIENKEHKSQFKVLIVKVIQKLRCKEICIKFRLLQSQFYYHFNNDF